MFDKQLMAKGVFIGTLCGILTAIIFMCILSAAMLTTGLLPQELTNFITIGFLALGSFAGAFISARITKSAGLITGAITGFVIFLLVTSTALIKSTEPITYLTAIRLGANLIMGSIGGIIGVNKKEKIHIK
ncbi:MAG: TIGR04086 family membrane protein [Ruminococcus sp.]|nr:TIGR04086 family membrane protein [Ruminococcus sp.]